MRTPIERFMERVVDTGDCWEWRGVHLPKGYAQFFFQGGKVYAHRWSHEWFKGPIPEGFVIDHLCQNRGCVNPDHLEAVTYRENNLRAHAANPRTACKWGHPYVEGSYVLWRNTRYCKECAARRSAESAARQRG